MRRGCLLIIGLAWLFSAQTALSAQSIKIYGDRDKKNAAAKELTITSNTPAKSLLVYVALGENPNASKDITVQLQGTMQGKLSLSQPANATKKGDTFTGSLTFTSSNWDKVQTVAVTYEGGAAAGEQARLVLTAADEQEEVITLKVVQQSQQPAAASSTNAIDPSDLPGSKLTVEEIFQNLVRYFLIFIGAAAFAAMIYAGLQYITAGGDAAKATQARRTIVLALVGILAAALSFVLVNLAANMRLSS